MIDKCEIVQDLLPLYVDSACSTSSAAMIEEHFDNCTKCKSLYEKLCSDSSEEILRAEVTEVVAKHEQQVKKKRILAIAKSVAITSIVALLVFGLLIWRVWPNSPSGIIPVEKNTITSFSSNVMINRIENGQTFTDVYRIDKTEAPFEDPERILEILETSSYQQDLRNLLPWSVDSIGADKSYDGRNAVLVFSMGNQKDEWVEINYLSSGIIVVFVGGEDGCRIYHPTNEKTFDDLIKHYETYGVKE